MDSNKHGLLVEAGSGPGVLHQVTGVMAEHDGDIGSVSILENSAEGSRVYFEVTTPRWEEMLGIGKPAGFVGAPGATQAGAKSA